MMAPITAWLLLTGTSGNVGSPWLARKCSRPSEAKRNRVIDWARTTTSAATGDSRNSPPPTVCITRAE